jgi:hypothetical protein
MLEIMLPTVFPVQSHIPVQAPVAVPVVVNVPLVAAGVQQLVGQIQDLVVNQVTIVQPPVAMEVEGDNEILKRLFLQKFGRALPEVDDVDLNMDLIDLTKDEDEMEVATSEVVQVVVKTEPVDDRRRSSRLRKTNVIKEKEAPLAAENVIADTDADMAEDVSNVNTVNPVGPVNVVGSDNNTVEPLTAAEAFEMAEAAIAESDAAIAANQKEMDKFFQ